MERLNILNRKNQKLIIILEINPKSKGLVFILHGLGGSKDQPHMQVMFNSFKDAGYNVVNIDATNSFGESEGKLEDATTTGFYEDLEDVISWAGKQKWYEEPFILAGHSLGAMSCALFAQKYPNKVKALAPISTVVSWELSSKIKSPEDLEDWKKKGVREWVSHTGKIKRLKWQFVEDRMQYNLLENINTLTMPILLIVGELDSSTPVEHQQYFYERLPGKKEIHIINNCEHTFRTEEELKLLRNYLDNWVKKL